MQQVSPKLLSIQVGLPKTLNRANSNSTAWTSGMFKNPVAGLVSLEQTNLAGDGQADLKVHGGPDKAVCVYPEVHYRYWQKKLSIPEFSSGSFGENFTVGELSEENVCIGDSFRIGEAVVQVSQPRQPCWKLARRWEIQDLALQVQEHGWTGWYFRVLKTGMVKAGLRIQLLERPHPEWTVAKANRIMHHDKRNLDAAAKLLAVPLLSASWRRTLSNRVAQIDNLPENRRLYANP